MNPLNTPLSEREEQILKEYHALCHAVQSGVKAEQESGSQDCTPKHLRAGINMSKCDHAALVNLLIANGTINREEYFDMLREFAQREVHSYEERLSKKYGKKVTLA